MYHKRMLSLCLALALAALAGCGGDGSASLLPSRKDVSSDQLQFQTPAQGDPIAIFDTSLGEVRAVLYPEYAPMAVENFIGLAESGYFDETVIFRSTSGFVVEGGDATGTGTGGTTIWNGNGYPIEYSEDLRHYAGALCAAADQESDPALCYSAFYVVAAQDGSVGDDLMAALESAGVSQEVRDTYQAAGGLPYLDLTDTVFGQVYSGMEVVDAMAAAEVDESQRPVEDIVIHSVTIDSYA